jgi:hypothetical protein
MECRSLLRVISQHVVGKKLPVGMQFITVLHSFLVDLVKTPFFFQILKSLDS